MHLKSLGSARRNLPPVRPPTQPPLAGEPALGAVSTWTICRIQCRTQPGGSTRDITRRHSILTPRGGAAAHLSAAPYPPVTNAPHSTTGSLPPRDQTAVARHRSTRRNENVRPGRRDKRPISQAPGGKHNQVEKKEEKPSRKKHAHGIREAGHNRTDWLQHHSPPRCKRVVRTRRGEYPRRSLV